MSKELISFSNTFIHRFYCHFTYQIIIHEDWSSQRWSQVTPDSRPQRFSSNLATRKKRKRCSTLGHWHLQLLDSRKQTLRPQLFCWSASRWKKLADDDQRSGCHLIFHHPPSEWAESERNSQEILCWWDKKQSCEVFFRVKWSLPHSQTLGSQRNVCGLDSIIVKIKDICLYNSESTHWKYLFDSQNNKLGRSFISTLHFWIYCIIITARNGGNWT